MEKLLDAIASRLKVRFITYESSIHVMSGLNVKGKMFGHREVTEKVRTLFKEKLKKNLAQKLGKLHVGEEVMYCFDYGEVRPMGNLREDANDNLAEVLLKLPELSEGESYEFPYDTYIVFKLSKKDNKGLTATICSASTWICEACEQQ